MKHRSLHLFWLILFIFPLLVLPQRQTLAATLTASNALELAGAIANANGTPATADTILLTSDINLETAAATVPGIGDVGLPSIQSPITIEGQGHTITRDAGAPNFRLFYVQSGSLTLVNITLDNGNSDANEGGAIWNGGTLNLTNTTISNSRSGTVAGAIYSLATLNITDSTLLSNYASNSGGAIYYDGGTLTISNSQFSFNTSGGSGGAVIVNAGATTITNSTFNGNLSTDGGAIFVSQFGAATVSGSTFNSNTSSDGGGIRNLNSLTVTNSTFANNGANNTGGGISSGVDTFGSATIQNSTFVGNQAKLSGSLNGAGISVVGGSASVSNSVFRGNSPVNDVCTNASGSNNLADGISLPTTCSGFTLSPTANINIGALTDNGGPTQTNPINDANSTAIDGTTTASCASAPVSGVDQRGVARAIDGNGTPSANDCDIGAYEFGGNIRTLQFTSAASSITPGGVTTMPVSLSLDAPLEIGYAPVTAYIWASGGTALAGTNYAPFGVQTVTFNPGDQTKTVTLNLINNSLNTDRTVILSFATRSGPGLNGPAKFGAQTTHTVTLKASGATAAPVRYYYGTRTITLSWTPTSWASGYEIQVDTDSAFATPRIAENTSLSAGTLSYDVTVPGNGTYYWRVRAKQANGTPAATYGPVQTFVVAGT